MTTNTKESSKEMASLASEILHNKDASATAKSLAGSVLAQRSTSKETGKKMEELASQVLQNKGQHDEATRKLAGSVLAQANKER